MHLCQRLFVEFSVRQAEITEYDLVRNFYHSIIDAMEDAEFKPQWKKDIYPAPAWLKEQLDKGNIYLGFYGNNLIGAMVLNNETNEGYAKVDWPSKVSYDQVMVIHALGIHPSYARNGLGRRMVTDAIEKARDKGCKAIRLDVLSGNIPAERLYESMAYKQISETQMYYEDTGWTVFKLYEYII